MKNYLLTPVGAYAISSGYVTISEFLTLSISVRETLNRLFNPTYLADANDHKLTINELKDMPAIKREMLVRLVTHKNGL